MVVQERGALDTARKTMCVLETPRATSYSRRGRGPLFPVCFSAVRVRVVFISSSKEPCGVGPVHTPAVQVGITWAQKGEATSPNSHIYQQSQCS